ncbi:gamma-tubulin complex component 2 [Spatholobus suberectus]|nr:gamma-tubulin complex component 2 [Spatholobus suberectus]
MSRGRSDSGGWLRGCLVVFAVVSALVVCGPALYWRFKNAIAVRNSHNKLSCPPCLCDCPPPLSLFQLAPGLANLSVSDCGSNDPDLKEEMEKQFVDLLSEELKLQESVIEANTRHMNITLAEAKRVASQYQREADKCIAATETCEQARERAEAILIKERKVTLVWERRARQMGWEGE